MSTIQLLQTIKDQSLVINYMVFYVGVTFVNKYVLSVLRFTYPTIFQGWQVLAGAIILRVLSLSGLVTFNTGEYTSTTLISWCPAMLFYTFSIYTGSIALANLPIPIYLAVHCSLTAANIIIDYLHKKKGTRELIFVPAMFIPILSTMWTDPQFNPTAYKWAGSHVVFLVLYSYFEKTYGSVINLSATDKLFCNYIFSMILLAPSSLLLGDVFAAQNFGFFRLYTFYAGCLASGVLGVLVSLHGIKLKQSESALPRKENLSALSKILAAVFSFNLFDSVHTVTNLTWIFVTLAINILVINHSSISPHALLNSNASIESNHVVGSSDKKTRQNGSSEGIITTDNAFVI